MRVLFFCDITRRRMATTNLGSVKFHNSDDLSNTSAETWNPAWVKDI